MLRTFVAPEDYPKLIALMKMVKHDVLKNEFIVKTLEETRKTFKNRVEDLKQQFKQYSDELSRLKFKLQTSRDSLTMIETSCQKIKKEYQHYDR